MGARCDHSGTARGAEPGWSEESCPTLPERRGSRIQRPRPGTSRRATMIREGASTKLAGTPALLGAGDGLSGRCSASRILRGRWAVRSRSLLPRRCAGIVVCLLPAVVVGLAACRTPPAPVPAPPVPAPAPRPSAPDPLPEPRATPEPPQSPLVIPVVAHDSMTSTLDRDLLDSH